MSQKYYPKLTHVGLAKLTNAALLNKQVSLTHMAVGDGSGSSINLDAKQLEHEVYRAQINEIRLDEGAENTVLAVLVIPVQIGGFHITELGLFDSDGDLVAVGLFPATYKPTLDEGTGREIRVQMKLQLQNPDVVTLSVDASVVLATLEDVAVCIKKHEQAWHYAGEFKNFPFRPDELPEHWYFRNGEFVDKNTPVGKRLLAMSANYKLDHRITETETHISLPNAFNRNGDGYFDRPVNGVGRQVGSVQGDAIRNITGGSPIGDSKAFLTHNKLEAGESKGAIAIHSSGKNNTAHVYDNTGGWVFWDFDAGRVVPVSHENRPVNYGLTPAVFLPPLEA